MQDFFFGPQASFFMPYGALALLPGILADVDGIEEALIYGSWAARFTGEVGADPNDIDVLVIPTVSLNSAQSAGVGKWYGRGRR